MNLNPKLSPVKSLGLVLLIAIFVVPTILFYGNEVKKTISSVEFPFVDISGSSRPSTCVIEGSKKVPSLKDYQMNRVARTEVRKDKLFLSKQAILLYFYIKDEQLSFRKCKVIPNETPNYFSGSYPFVARIVSFKGKVLSEHGIKEPRIFYVERSGTEWKNELEWGPLILPYFENADKIKIYSGGKLIAGVDIQDCCKISEIVKDLNDDWKTYQSKNYGYKIEYPRMWLIEAPSHEGTVSFERENCSFKVVTLSDQRTYQEHLEISEGCEKKEEKIGGVSFTKVNCPTRWGFTRYYFQQSNNFFYIEYSDSLRLLKPGETIPAGYIGNCEYYFDQMLKSLQF